MDYIFLVSSSGGMRVGLKLGTELYGLDVKLSPISSDKLGYEYAILHDAVLELLLEVQKTLCIEKNIYN